MDEEERRKLEEKLKKEKIETIAIISFAIIMILLLFSTLNWHPEGKGILLIVELIVFVIAYMGIRNS